MVSLVQTIADDLTRQIEQGTVATGSRLLSIRAAASKHQVSKNTIVEVYDRMVASGHLDPRRGSGFYVTQPKARSINAPTKHFIAALDSVSLLREQLNQSYAVRAGDGRPPAHWMQSSDLSLLSSRTKTDTNNAIEFEYGIPQGLTSLRQAIARTLRERSIEVDPEHVLLTVGANHAFDLIIRHLVEADDDVLVETPGYYPLFGKLQLQKANIVGVMRGASGLDLDDLDNKAGNCHARLLFVQPMAHNPLGTSMNPAAMHRLLKIAERHDLIVVEDDPFADILPQATPHLAALDGLERVLYVGTFSKTLSPSLRCGYIAGSSKIISSLTDIKMLTLVNSSSMVEQIIQTIIMRGRYRRHLLRLRDRVTAASAEACTALKSIGFKNIRPPTGGYYLWCPLPEHLDDLEVARQAATEGIFLAPGSLFLQQDEPAAPALRINIAHATNKRLLTFLEKLII